VKRHWKRIGERRGVGNQVMGATVAVVVMGDVGRSPRMVNHARELARNGFSPVLIGYRGREFDAPDGVRIVGLDGGRSAPRGSSGLGFAIAAGLRMSRIFLALFRALLREKPRVILVQNPPSFPTLTAAALAARWLGSGVVVDWHNYGFSLLALRLGDSHWLVRLARWYEFRAGRGARTHLCVSRAMRDDLWRRGIDAEVLYDWPWYVPPARGGSQPGFIAVCPAGWTSDEDIEMLLDALGLMRDTALTVYITGEGVKRKDLEPRLLPLRAKGVLIDTGFLPETEYRALIGRAHLGLSLHRSSSGLDLAMKVVDLFGAGVPVCAFDYGGSVGEQIEDGVTGFLFRTAAELAALLSRLQSDAGGLSVMRAAVRERWPVAWDAEWKRTALPALAGMS